MAWEKGKEEKVGEKNRISFTHISQNPIVVDVLYCIWSFSCSIYLCWESRRTVNAFQFTKESSLSTLLEKALYVCVCTSYVCTCTVCVCSGGKMWRKSVRAIVCSIRPCLHIYVCLDDGSMETRKGMWKSISRAHLTNTYKRNDSTTTAPLLSHGVSLEVGQLFWVLGWRVSVVFCTLDRLRQEISVIPILPCIGR